MPKTKSRPAAKQARGPMFGPFAKPVEVVVVNRPARPVPVRSGSDLASMHWAFTMAMQGGPGPAYWVLSSDRSAIVELVSGRSSPGVLTISWQSSVADIVSPSNPRAPFVLVDNSSVTTEAFVGADVRIPVPASGVIPPTRVDVPWDLITYPDGSTKRLLKIALEPPAGSTGTPSAELTLIGRFTD